MKKTKKSNTGSPIHTASPKGQKLAYAKLRMLAIETIQNSKSPSWTPRQLIKKMKIANGKADMVRVLDALVKQGKLATAGEEIYTSLMRPKVPSDTPRPAKAVAVTGKNIHEGRVDMTRSGSAYVIIEDMEEDIYVPAKYTGGAMHKDIVQVDIIPGRKGRKPEGRVVAIVKRALEQVIGTLKMYKKFAVLTPDRMNIQFDIIVPMDKLSEAVDGDKVVVKITDWSQSSPSGEVVHVLGASVATNWRCSLSSSTMALTWLFRTRYLKSA